jgi:hypothetical protein
VTRPTCGNIVKYVGVGHKRLAETTNGVKTPENMDQEDVDSIQHGGGDLGTETLASEDDNTQFPEETPSRTNG